MPQLASTSVAALWGGQFGGGQPPDAELEDLDLSPHVCHPGSQSRSVRDTGRAFLFCISRQIVSETQVGY